MDANGGGVKMQSEGLGEEAELPQGVLAAVGEAEEPAWAGDLCTGWAG